MRIPNLFLWLLGLLWMHYLSRCSNGALLTNVSQIHGWSSEGTNPSPRVNLQGTVLWNQNKSILLRDLTGSIFVTEINDERVEPGHRFEIDGIIIPLAGGGRAVKAEKWSMFGPGPPEISREASIHEILARELEPGSVTVRGVVRKALLMPDQATLLVIFDGGSRLPIYVRKGDGAWPNSLVGARIKASGVVLTEADDKIPAHPPYLGCWTASQIVIERNLERSFTNAGFSSIRLLNEKAKINPYPVRIRGVVTAVINEQSCYIQDSSGAILASFAEPVNLSRGLQLEIAGFRGEGKFEDAVVVDSTPGEPIEPHFSQPSSWLFGEVVGLEGELLKVFPTSNGVSRLVVSNDYVGINVLVTNLAPADAWLPESIVEVSGVWLPHIGKGGAIYVQSASDAVVIKAGTRWTPNTAQGVLLGLICAAVLIILLSYRLWKKASA